MNKYQLKCNSCGRFINRFYRYVPFGNSFDTEPSEAEDICKTCYDECDKEVLNKTAWIKPFFVDLID